MQEEEEELKKVGGLWLGIWWVERSEAADLAAPLLGLAAGRSRRGSHDHEKQQHPGTGARSSLENQEREGKEERERARGVWDGWMAI